MDEQVGVKRCSCGSVVGEYDIVCAKCGKGLEPGSLTGPDITKSTASVPGICNTLAWIGTLSIVAGVLLCVAAVLVSALFFAYGLAALISGVLYFAISHLCEQSQRQTELLSRIAEKIDDRAK
jgi:hypothetical protein